MTHLLRRASLKRKTTTNNAFKDFSYLFEEFVFKSVLPSINGLQSVTACVEHAPVLPRGTLRAPDNMFRKKREVEKVNGSAPEHTVLIIENRGRKHAALALFL